MTENQKQNDEQEYKLDINKILSVIVDIDYVHTKKTTICIMKLKNGFEIIGKAGVIVEENFDREKGKKISYDRALDQVWLVEGYRVQQKYFDEILINKPPLKLEITF